MKQILYAAALALAGCTSQVETQEVKEQPQVETQAIKEQQDPKQEYVICGNGRTKNCIDRWIADRLHEEGVAPKVVNSLSNHMDGGTIFLLKREGCDLKRYSTLLDHIGFEGEVSAFGPLSEALCSGIRVEDVDRITEQYAPLNKDWALVCHNKGIDVLTAKRYDSLEKRTGAYISGDAILGFEKDIKDGKTTFKEVEGLLRKEYILRNVNRFWMDDQ